MASFRSGISVALLCGPGGFGDRVRESMGALGAPVVYEAEPQAFDRSALEHSQANVVVVNLDARSDADLDNVYELLDDARYRVVFNDDEVSGGLTGWDQARWMRHLAAKILGDADIDPPRPVDAEAVPAPTGPIAKSAAAVDVAEATQASRAAHADSKPTPSVQLAPSVPPIDSDPTVDEVDAAPVAPARSALDAVETVPEGPGNALHDTQDAAIDALDLSGFDDLTFDLDVPASAVPPALPVDAGPAINLDFDLNALDFDAPGVVAPASGSAVEEPFSADDIDLDALDFDSLVAAGNESELEFGNESESPIAAASATASTTADPAPDDAPIAADDAGLAFASNEWTLEDVLDETPAPPSMPPSAATFGIEKLRAEEFLAPDVEVNEAHPFEVPQGLSLELIPLDEAVAPMQTEVASRENWLDPDSVQPKVRRVWVLGASIGGPEAVREFLAALPRDYPALFVLAQHLGDEFVDMMAKQLAQATALTVRTPAHGERVGHGEVVIVPNGKRLLVDPMGVVVLERDTEERAFSPSIDCVLRDIADRFGSNAGAIVFSGMTDDAVEGCQYLAQKGGLIYAQSQDTCVVSTMIDGVCETGIVKFQGSPQALAEKLISA